MTKHHVMTVPTPYRVTQDESTKRDKTAKERNLAKIVQLRKQESKKKISNNYRKNDNKERSNKIQDC